jgi:hypothetical protein
MESLASRLVSSWDIQALNPHTAQDTPLLYNSMLMTNIGQQITTVVDGYVRPRARWLQVSEWYQRFEAMRAPAKRRLPSYLAVKGGDGEQKDESQKKVNKVVPMETMLRFNSPLLTRRVVTGEPLGSDRARTRRNFGPASGPGSDPPEA